VFPNLVPAILSGAALAFARAVGEFGSVVLLVLSLLVLVAIRGIGRFAGPRELADGR